MTDIKPTIGRKIWYYPDRDSDALMLVKRKGDPLDATVVFVHDDGSINISIYDHRGYQHRREAVHIAPDGPQANVLRGYCAWMPFQKGQAARTEAAEKKAGQEFVGQPLAIDPKLQGGET